jgi:ethanolamine ammonia-lyase small subunit
MTSKRINGKDTARLATPGVVTPSPIDRESLTPWTAARVALGRAGASLPTAAHLAFLHDHARARDAVWGVVDFDELALGLEAMGVASVRVRSEARDRAEYLRRPDLGRRLDAESAARLAPCSRGARVAIVVAAGLSAEAVASNALVLLEALLPRLEAAVRRADKRGDAEAEPELADASGASEAVRDLVPGAVAAQLVGAVVLAEQARVAIGDPVAEALGAELVIVLIGERPGLSAADSLGCYLTWSPKTGTVDSQRNCISNIRLGGLAPAEAARRIAWLAAEALRLGVSGIALKDGSGSAPALDGDDGSSR